VTSFGNYIKLSLRRSVHLPVFHSALHTRFYFLLFTFFLLSCENDPREIENWTKKVELKEEAKTVESYLSQA
jgi:hypothetical protein